MWVTRMVVLAAVALGGVNDTTFADGADRIEVELVHLHGDDAVMSGEPAKVVLTTELREEQLLCLAFVF
jgi:hypothetical protein